MAPPEATGTLTIDQGEGPFHYGDTLTFTTTSSNLRGGHEMVEVALFQDNAGVDEDGNLITPGDGVLDMFLSSEDLVGLTLNHPEQPVPLALGPNTDTSLPAKGWARLLSYGWKGRQQFIDLLDVVEFDVEP